MVPPLRSIGIGRESVLPSGTRGRTGRRGTHVTGSRYVPDMLIRPPEAANRAQPTPFWRGWTPSTMSIAGFGLNWSSDKSDTAFEQR